MSLSAGLDGIPVRQTDLAGAVADFLAQATSHERAGTWRFLNSYSLAVASKDRPYQRLLAKGGVNVPDGLPLAIALRRLGHPDIEQVRGPSFFNECLDVGRSVGARHYFLGGTPALLTELVAEARRRFPGVAVAGVDSPPFRPLTVEERKAQDARIADAQPDIVWVGLGTPKQDFEAQRICDELGLCTAGVGAAFDFLAGVKRQAPPVLSKIGLEWLFRLATEPRRLWKRYLFGNARFLMIVFRSWQRRSARGMNV